MKSRGEIYERFVTSKNELLEHFDAMCFCRRFGGSSRYHRVLCSTNLHDSGGPMLVTESDSLSSH